MTLVDSIQWTYRLLNKPSHYPKLFDLFRDGMPSLSASYNISGLVPACWLLFQCFVLKPAKLPKSLYIWTCPGIFLRDEQWKWTKTYMITCIYIMSWIVHSYFLRFWRYSDKQTNRLLFLLLPYEVYSRDIPDFGSRVALATWQTDRLVLELLSRWIPS